jgi:membrane protein implicated in regulation of membrane protease activity
MFALSDALVWWLLAGMAVAAELFIGMFYLLMLAVGLAAGARAAHLGLSPGAQMLCAAVLGSALVLVCYGVRRRRAGLSSPPDRDLKLDIGERVMVEQWQADGTASVRYRGAQWTAIPAPGTLPTCGLHRVRDLEGNHLVLEKI